MDLLFHCCTALHNPQAYVVYGLMESYQGNADGENDVLLASKSVFGADYDFRQQREAVTAAYEQGELGEL